MNPTIPLARLAMDALERHDLDSHAGFARFLLDAGAVLMPASEVSWEGDLPWDPPETWTIAVVPAPPRFVLRLDVPMEVAKAWMTRQRKGIPWTQELDELTSDPDSLREHIVVLWMSRKGRAVEELVREWDSQPPPYMPLQLHPGEDVIYAQAGFWILGSRWYDPAPLPVWLDVSRYVQRGLGGRFRLCIPEDSTP